MGKWKKGISSNPKASPSFLLRSSESSLTPPAFFSLGFLPTVRRILTGEGQPCSEEPGWGRGTKPRGPSISSLWPAWLPAGPFSRYPTVNCPPRKNPQHIGCEGGGRRVGPGTPGPCQGGEGGRKSGTNGPVQGEMENPHPLFTPQVRFPYVGKCGGPRVSNSSPLTPSTP